MPGEILSRAHSSLRICTTGVIVTSIPKLSNEVPRVFISYAHDGGEQDRLIGQLQENLRGRGVDARTDQQVYFPEGGWLAWTRQELKKAKFILAVFDSTYKRSWEGGRTRKGRKGSRFEAVLLAQEIFNEGGENRRVIPIVTHRDNLRHIPLELQRYAHFDISQEREFKSLFAVLTSQIGTGTAPKMNNDLNESLAALPHLSVRTFSGRSLNPETPRAPIDITGLLEQPISDKVSIPVRELQTWKRIIEAGSGPLICRSGPGTASLTLLTERVIALVESGVPPTQILVLTLDDRAAPAIFHKLDEKLKEAVQGIICGTFEQAAITVLRRYCHMVGHNANFTVLDEKKSLELMAEAINGRIRPKGHLAKSSFVLPEARVIHRIHAYATATLLPLEIVLMDRFPWLFRKRNEIAALLDLYDRTKRRHGVMDAQDLLSGWHHLLCQSRILEEQRFHWRHVVVWGFHEGTRLQSLIMHAIAGPEGRNLMVIADEWQSIGSDHGADLQNFMALRKLYPNSTTLDLELTFRSTPSIVDLENSITHQGSLDLRRTLVSYRDPSISRGVRKSPGSKPKLVRSPEPVEQARWILEEVERLRREGESLRGVAVLYRSLSSALELHLEIRERGILVVGGTAFFDQDHILDTLACMRASLDREDESAWLRCLSTLSSVDAWTARLAWSHVAKKDEGAIASLLPANAQTSWKALYSTIETLRALSKPEDMIAAILQGYVHHLQIRFTDYPECISGMKRLAWYSSRFKDPRAFLEQMPDRLDAPSWPGLNPRSDRADAVTVLTIADARGYEFKTVFVLGLVEGELPLAGTPLGAKEDEERRQLFVAVSRARERLYLMCPEMGPEGPAQQSRFLTELYELNPSELFEEIDISKGKRRAR